MRREKLKMNPWHVLFYKLTNITNIIVPSNFSNALFLHARCDTILLMVSYLFIM